MDIREAFEQASYANEWDLWQAACEWQRQRDAEIADYFGDTTVVRDAIIEQWQLPT